jgi:stalled ribosome rescue protein Dom34
MMQNYYHAVVWIDHRQARIFHFNKSESEKVVMRPDNPARHLHHKANSIGSGHAPEDQNFLEEVAKSVGDAGAILIVGPSSEKNELVKHIKRTHPEMTIKIEGVETLDHPTDGELVAFARRYLKSADLMRPQS